MLVLRIVLQNITKPLDSLGNGRNPLASVNHNVPRCPPNAWENCSSAEKKAELTRVRMARYRQNKKEKEKAKESVIVNSNVTRAASTEETIQPFAAVLVPSRRRQGGTKRDEPC